MTDPLRQKIAATARLIVVKIGTRVLTGSDGLLDASRIESVAAACQRLLAEGRRLLIVSSGAVGAGMGRLGLRSRPQSLPHLQAIAAIGQSSLIEAYERALRPYGRHVAQVLLVAEDLEDRVRYLNIRNTMHALLDFGAVPVINENDTVSVEELRTSFGDNDRLAALVATLVGADLLVLLSDVPGLFDRDPGVVGAELVSHVPRIDASVMALACDRLGGVSKGGMGSKIRAAGIVTESGCDCVIASGKSEGVLEAICRGELVGTLFSGRTVPMPAWKRWLGWSAPARGTLTVDGGAHRAVIAAGRSLLAAGVTAVDGDFAVGDVVELRTVGGPVFARGLVNYPDDDVRRILGLQTERIATVLGSCPYEEVVHRDNLAVIRRDEAA
jgi:glutamate 5-kinase